MNKKKLSELIGQGKSIDSIIKLCREEKSGKGESTYDLSENGLNTFGYSLMHQKRHTDALAIFKLNVEFYPTAFNTHDSLGECLLEMEKKREALDAYRRSLELNPGNKNAERILQDHKLN